MGLQIASCVYTRICTNPIYPSVLHLLLLNCGHLYMDHGGLLESHSCWSPWIHHSPHTEWNISLFLVYTLYLLFPNISWKIKKPCISSCYANARISSHAIQHWLMSVWEVDHLSRQQQWDITIPEEHKIKLKMLWFASRWWAWRRLDDFTSTLTEVKVATNMTLLH